MLAATYRVECCGSPRPTRSSLLRRERPRDGPGGGRAPAPISAAEPSPIPRRCRGIRRRIKPGAKRVLEVALNAGLMILAIAWYGLWAALGVAILGAIFLGWWDDPPPPPPKPAPQLRVLEQRVVRDGATSRYIAIVHNDSRRLAAVGVYPFGEFRDRHGHRRGAPDKRHGVELRPTIPPGATGVVYDEIDRPLPRGAPAARSASPPGWSPRAARRSRSGRCGSTGGSASSPPAFAPPGPWPAAGSRRSGATPAGSGSPERSRSARCRAATRPRCSTGSLPTPACRRLPRLSGIPGARSRAGAVQAQPPLGIIVGPGCTRGRIASGP